MTSHGEITKIPIALVGCGGISAAHLTAYRDAGLTVSVLADRTLSKAEARRDEFFPDASATDDLSAVWNDPDIMVVDVATHVEGRDEIIRAALSAGKNVLSQKPFVLDLTVGEELVALAERDGVVLAVNQNGRWAPHFHEALRLVSEGAIGELVSADFAVYWPHDRVFEHDPHFSTMADLVLYDFGIHWFDVIAQLLAHSGRVVSVYALTRPHPTSAVAVDTDASIAIVTERAHASILFRASSHWAESGTFRIEGTSGGIAHRGESLGGETVEVHDSTGTRSIELRGDWWSAGMIGTMSELLDAVADGGRPSNAAETSLAGLSLCFAALESARTGLPVDPATVRRYRRER